jgi:hypothetical protein
VNAGPRWSALTVSAAAAVLAIVTMASAACRLSPPIIVTPPLAQLIPLEIRAGTERAVAWYDTLGYPDAKGLRYVRVATGRWSQSGNEPRENRFVEGFLVREDTASFTVFLCNVSSFASGFEVTQPYPPLATVRFARRTSGPAYQQVGYDVLDFRKVASEVLGRVRQQASSSGRFLLDGYGRPVTHRARIFAFARASLQQGLSDVGAALIDLAANIPIEQSGKAEPERLLEVLQQQLGDAVLAQSEVDAGDLSPWAELLKVYAQFERRFTASHQVAYAREEANILRRMIADDADHHPKPLEQMSAGEQAAEDIYQLRSLKVTFVWISNNRYPIGVLQNDAQDVITPVHRLVDLGNEAVPQLIEALDDHSLTRSMVPSFNGTDLPRVMRVSDFAQHILEFMSGRNFFARRTDDGRLVNGTSRQQAEAWWAERQAKGEKQTLIDQIAARQSGQTAVRQVVERYPDAALDAINAGIRVAGNDFERGELVALASGLQGDAVMAFLRSKLAPGADVPSQIAAATILFQRGQPEAIPAMIEAWRNIQPRLPANQANAYDEVGGLITFLAKSGDAGAIDALGHDLTTAPVDVRLAVVRVFLPWPHSAGGFSTGKGVDVRADIANLPGGAAGAAIERLLIASLDDTERRLGMKGTYDEATFTDPRVCDMAALVLSKRWPTEYAFHWSATAAECDAQIDVIRNTWRLENGLPPSPPRAPAAR